MSEDAYESIESAKMDLLTNIAMLLLASLKDKKKGAVYGLNKSFQSCCEHLIDIILSIETDSALQVTIAKLCERYWVVDLPNKTFMVKYYNYYYYNYKAIPIQFLLTVSSCILIIFSLL